MSAGTANLLWLLALVLAVAGIALFAIARFWPERRPVSGPVSGTIPTVRGDVALSPAALGAGVVPLVRAITWPRLVDEGATDLEADERRGMIEALGIVGDPWAATILAVAYDEEGPVLRDAILDALGNCGSDVTSPLERAYRSASPAERYEAVDVASRYGQVALLVRALSDNDPNVALAAAYGLACAGRDDVLRAWLVHRGDGRAAEIRRVLALLEA